MADNAAFATAITCDPLGHCRLVNMPDTLELAFKLNGIIAVTASTLFVDVTGMTTGSSIKATDTETILGHSEMAVELAFDCTEATCTCRMGFNGGLSGRNEITYSPDIL